MSRALCIYHGIFGRVALLDMDRSLVRHAHPLCHILLKLGGKDTHFIVNERLVPLNDSAAVLINPWETHAYVHEDNQQNTLILALYLEPRWLRQNFPHLGNGLTAHFFPQASGSVQKPLLGFAHNLVEEMLSTTRDSLTKNATLADISSYIITHFFYSDVNRLTSGRPLLRQVPDRRIARALDIIRNNPEKIPDVSALARHACLSRAHFFRLFEQETGVTPHIFANAIKIEHAVVKIAESNAGLAQLGVQLGFQSPSQFSRFFRDHVSIPPREFRARLSA